MANNKAKTGVNKYIIWIKIIEPMSSKQAKSEACNRRMRHVASQLTPTNESRLKNFETSILSQGLHFRIIDLNLSRYREIIALASREGRAKLPSIPTLKT